jgi:hypothetical protein
VSTYQKAGFLKIKEEVEWVNDPWETGLIKKEWIYKETKDES